MFPILFEIGAFRLEGFTLFAVLGATLAMLFFRHGAARLCLEARETALLTGAGMFGAFIGGRLVYVLVNSWYFEHRWLEVFVFWRGGLVSYGGILGLLIAVGLAARARALPVLAILDMAAIASAIAVGVGRLGCFAAGCDYGTPAEQLPWSVVYSDPASAVPTELFGVALHPVQLYSLAVNAAVVVLATGLWKRSRTPGLVLGVELILYAVGRWIVEYWRGDADRGFFFGGALSTAQTIAVTCFFVGIGIVAHVLRAPRARNEQQ